MLDINLFFLNTIIDILVLCILVFYLVYILISSENTTLYKSYIMMHVLCILFILCNFSMKISWKYTIQSICKNISIIIYIFFIISFFIFSNLYIKNKKNLDNNPFSQILLLTIIFLLYITALLFSIKVFITPINICSIILFIAFSIFFLLSKKNSFFNTIPIFISNSLDLAESCILVFNKNGENIYKNTSCEAYDINTQDILINKCSKVINHNSFLNNINKKNIKISESNKVFNILLQSVKSFNNKPLGYVAIVHDDTKIYKSINRLKEKQMELEEINRNIIKLSNEEKNLLILKERNILSKEINDVMGHSLNFALQVLEGNKIIIDESPQKALQRLEDSIEIIDTSLIEIATMPLDIPTKQMDNFYMFIEDLKQISLRLNDIGVTFQLVCNTKNDIKNPNILKSLFRVCQEAITNAIKHGKSKNIVFSISCSNNLISFHIINDGKSPSSFVKGNGLNGIEDRIRNLEGNVSFNVLDDSSGFIIHGTIPNN